MTHPPSQDPWNASAETERQFSLGEMTTPTRRRRTGMLVALAAALLVVAAGVGAVLASRTGRHLVTGSSSPTPAWSPITWGSSDRMPTDIQQVCDLNERMRDGQADGDLRGQGATINQIQSLGSQSAVFDVKFAANMLKDRYDLAVAAKGGALAASTTIDLFTASIQLSTACTKAGWSKS